MRFEGASGLVIAFALGAGIAGAQELPEAPLPQAASSATTIQDNSSNRFRLPAAGNAGVVGLAQNFFNSRSIDYGSTYDFMFQQKLGNRFSLVAGITNANFDDPALFARRQALRQILGLRPGEASSLVPLLAPAPPRDAHAGGIMAGVQISLGKRR